VHCQQQNPVLPEAIVGMCWRMNVSDGWVNVGVASANTGAVCSTPATHSLTHLTARLLSSRQRIAILPRARGAQTFDREGEQVSAAWTELGTAARAQRCLSETQRGYTEKATGSAIREASTFECNSDKLARRPTSQKCQDATLSLENI
jgi:hypothetical protein